MGDASIRITYYYTRLHLVVDCWYTFHLLYQRMSHTHLFHFIVILYIYKWYILTHCEVEGLPHSENRVFNVHVFLEEPDNGHNRPKLVAQNLQTKRYNRVGCDWYFVKVDILNNNNIMWLTGWLTDWLTDWLAKASCLHNVVKAPTSPKCGKKRAKESLQVMDSRNFNILSHKNGSLYCPPETRCVGLEHDFSLSAWSTAASSTTPHHHHHNQQYFYSFVSCIGICVRGMELKNRIRSAKRRLLAQHMPLVVNSIAW
jgi:hypothetical protein